MSNKTGFEEIDLQWLRSFVVIAKSKSLTEAADILRIDKSRVSRILSSLEEALGVELVSRNTRQFDLTPLGRQLRESTEAHLLALEEATFLLSSRSESPKGHIKLTLAHGLATDIVPELLGEFMRIHPEVTIELVISQERLVLAKEGIDLAIRVGSMPDSGLKSKRAGKTGTVLVASRRFLEGRSPIRHPRDLAGVPMAGLSAFQGEHIQLTSKSGEKFRLKGDFVFSANSPIPPLTIVQQGLAIGLVPAVLCRRGLLAGELEIALEGWSGPEFPFHIVHRYQSTPPAQVRALVDFLSVRFSSALRYG